MQRHVWGLIRTAVRLPSLTVHHFRLSLNRVLLNDNPDIIISTPTRLHALLQSKAIDLTHLSFLAIDEADLLLSYGHKDDLTRIMDPSSGWVPRLGVQGCLMSATLGEDVLGVKGLVLRNPVCLLSSFVYFIPSLHLPVLMLIRIPSSLRRSLPLLLPLPRFTPLPPFSFLPLPLTQAILTLSEPATSACLLTQHCTHSTERDKFLLIYVLLKLKLIRGKSIVFVNDVERGYRVKLFLEQFGVKTCVVNAELPLASRYHVVEEFNRGVYDVVVATDEGAGGELDNSGAKEEEGEGEVDGEGDGVEVNGDGPVVEPDGEETEEDKKKDGQAEDGADEGKQADDVEEGGPEGEEQLEAATEPKAGPSKTNKRPAFTPPHARSKRRRGDPASSLARGIDFTSASSVINFDLPTTSTAYMHRVGRTARAGHSGLALSFIVPKDQWGKDKVVSLKSARNDEVVWERIKERVRAEGGGEMKEWDWGGRKGEVEGFRYRVEGAVRAVTGKRVAEARREEVRRELLNSEKLKVCHRPWCNERADREGPVDRPTSQRTPSI